MLTITFYFVGFILIPIWIFMMVYMGIAVRENHPSAFLFAQICAAIVVSVLASSAVVFMINISEFSPSLSFAEVIFEDGDSASVAAGIAYLASVSSLLLGAAVSIVSGVRARKESAVP
ncbi:hypothetical protein [Demequina oxidasica]|uniref:hypothetical protein n=1 Tax=Demequina oxidasica TaxID=676199 RepID=UPI00128BE94C|nr:hypothetical protein [Demequina oxidasica]